MAEKHYETDERGELDAGARDVPPVPCAKRIAHGQELAVSRITWCEHPEGHQGSCSGPIPWPMAFGPIRRGK